MSRIVLASLLDLTLLVARLNAGAPESLVQKLAADAPAVRECVDKGGASKVAQALEVHQYDLGGPGKQAVGVTLGRVPDIDGCDLCAGARRCTEWVYATDGGYRLLLTAEAIDALKVLKTSTKGYKDIELVYPAGNNYPATTSLYRFDGQRYVEQRTARPR